MKIFLLLVLALCTPSTTASENSVTILVEHFEKKPRNRAEREALQGRRWDIESLLRSFAPVLEWNQLNSGRNGISGCIKLKEPGNERALRNLLTQLSLRRLEMENAGADFRVVFPSDCGDSRRRLAVR